MDQAKEDARRTAGEAGWHASRYNLMAKVPGSDNVAIANLFKGTCAEYNLIEVYLLSMIEQLSERHPPNAARYSSIASLNSDTVSDMSFPELVWHAIHAPAGIFVKQFLENSLAWIAYGFLYFP